MKTLIVGSSGQLGVALQEKTPAEATVCGVDLPDLDITDEDAVCRLVSEEKPDVIINAAAYTAVDKAESEPEIAHAVNVIGVRYLATAALDVGARLIHVSTDFVFDGQAERPYRPNDETNPQSVYGKTKRDGELELLRVMPDTGVVVRTAWLYSKTGSNFVKTILKLLQTRDELSVVIDQVGAPTWADSLAVAIWRFTKQNDLSGLFHWTDEGEASRYEQATAIQEEAKSLGIISKEIPIRNVETTVKSGDAVRPSYSVLDCTESREAIGLEASPWRHNLRMMLEGMNN